MTARKLIEFGGGQFRLVRVHKGFTAIERVDGCDWLRKQRWQCVRLQDTTRKNFRQFEGNCYVDEAFVRELLNALGDALMRRAKRGRRRRKP